MSVYAHSANGDGQWHGLPEHLRRTAALARGFAEVFGAGELAAYLGLVHDVGKAACGWQAALLRAEKDEPIGIDHKLAGTWLAHEQGLGPLAAAVFGHHGGLPSRATLKAALMAVEASEWERVTEAVTRAAELVPEIHPGIRPSLPDWVAGRPDAFAAELLLRLVFSALVDADFLDTEQHFNGGELRRSVSPVGVLADAFERSRAQLLTAAEPSPVDAIREQVYEQAVAAAVARPGMFRLPAPTGSGKTIAAGGFAVHHARRYGLGRVVVAVPFLSITQQNAQVYRQLFGEDHVLEHHSGVNLDGGRRASRWQRLAAENWDAPFVVTTTVQLFESLFSNRPSAMRKLHRLAGSVIVLDEVQALPDRLLLPILSVLRHLTEYFGTTVLLASATQPAFFELSPFRELQIHDVIARPEHLYGQLRRARYEWWLRPKPTLRQVAERAGRERQVLVIANTTKDAADLHRHLSECWTGEGPVLHLSTRMAAAHRNAVLEQIRERLAVGEPVAVVSTQLVEAGVDLDFPIVIRAWASADALQQAAGRANRNGLLPYGRVIVFDPADGDPGAWAVYGAALTATRRHFGPGRAFPDDPGALALYYKERFELKGVEDASVGTTIQQLRRDLDFPEVARLFKMIDERTVPVITRYATGDAARECDSLLRLLRSPKPAPAWVFRKLQPHLAAIPRSAVADGSPHPVRQLVGDLYEWRGAYHPQRGIELTPPKDQENSL
ncbi:CRISPR-associated helicase Cas3' [Actinoallomurus sp. NPDC052308]|uniref:CRISPR-associated helicase Cas3' n=1 Tax=Actinoallomurus sp. NPDC052308 TaxID=3155530 RepID=UPI0034322C42